MFYQLPVTIYEESDCVYNHRSEIAELGTKALIVTGRHSSKANGSLADVEGALRVCGISYVIFDEIEENPSVETVMRARRFGLEQGADFVVGVGGGSPIDAAKAIAIMMHHAERDASFLYERTPGVGAVPIAAVPTTCGTGSEVTAVSVLTVHEKRTKVSLPHRVFPTLALIDAKYLKDAPQCVITATAVDALAHLIESYINTAVSDYVRMFVHAGLSAWRAGREAALGKGKPEAEALRNLLNASTFAGMAIAHAGTTIPHSLSYMITYEMGVAHGTAVGCFLPGYLREASQEDCAYILRTAGFSDMKEFEDFIAVTCRVPDIPEELMQRSVRSVLDNPAKLKACPYALSSEVLYRMKGENRL